eukprot:COSAG03_NODE_4659_length_1476_cov_1.968773_2_plen_220_part_01
MRARCRDRAEAEDRRKEREREAEQNTHGETAEPQMKLAVALLATIGQAQGQGLPPCTYTPPGLFLVGCADIEYGAWGADAAVVCDPSSTFVCNDGFSHPSTACPICLGGSVGGETCTGTAMMLLGTCSNNYDTYQDSCEVAGGFWTYGQYTPTCDLDPYTDPWIPPTCPAGCTQGSDQPYTYQPSTCTGIATTLPGYCATFGGGVFYTTQAECEQNGNQW